MTDFGTETRSAGGSGLVPPQAIQAERAVLAAMMLGQEAIARAIESIGPGAFYRTAHQKIFEAIVQVYDKHEPADLITVGEQLRKNGHLEAIGGVAFLAGVFEEATTSANIEAHIKIVAEKALLRQMIRATTNIQEQCYAASDDADHILDSAEAQIFAISDKQVRKGPIQLK